MVAADVRRRIFRKNCTPSASSRRRLRFLTLDPRAYVLDQRFHFLQRCHGRVAGSCHGKRAVGGPIFDSFLRIVELEKAIDKAAGKAITAADAIEDFQILAVARFVTCPSAQQIAPQSFRSADFTERKVVAMTLMFG